MRCLFFALCILLAGCEATSTVEGSKTGASRDVQVSGPDHKWSTETIITIGAPVTQPSQTPNP